MPIDLPCREGEIWRPVLGYEDLYAVSNQGRLASLRRGVKLLRSAANAAGYIPVSLRRDGKGVSTYRHTLVAAAFIGPRPLGHQIRHLDGDPANNWSSNLAYGTQSDNEADKLRHGRRPSAGESTHCRRGHEFTTENTALSAAGQRECRTCTRANARASETSRAARLAADPSLAPHGRESTYDGWRCRCGPCRAAHTEGARRRRGVA